MLFQNLALGASTAVVAFGPFYGRVLGFPARAFVLLALVFATIATFVHWRSARRPPWADAAALALGAILLVLAVASSSPAQIDFIFSLSSWVSSNEDYVASKLLMALAGFGPALYVCLLLSFVPDQERQTVALAYLAGTVAIGLLAVLRIVPNWPSIITDDITVAWEFLSNPNHGFSRVGYSAVFVSAAVASLIFASGGSLRHVLSGGLFALFITAVFVLNQRANVIITAALLVGWICWSLIFRINWKPRLLTFSAATVAGGLCIALVLNPQHTYYWADLAKGLGSPAISERIDALSTAIAVDEGGGQAALLPQPVAEAQAPVGKSTLLWPHLLTGAGLGSFAVANPDLLYPHNIFVELWLEMGSVAVLSLGALVCMAALGGATATNRYSSTRLVVALVSASVLLHSLKAGDISGLGVLFITLFLVQFTRSGEQKETSRA